MEAPDPDAFRQYAEIIGPTALVFILALFGGVALIRSLRSDKELKSNDSEAVRLAILEERQKHTSSRIDRVEGRVQRLEDKSK